jgi:ADP-heptose:LPS heptosyltransferase
LILCRPAISPVIPARRAWKKRHPEGRPFEMPKWYGLKKKQIERLPEEIREMPQWKANVELMLAGMLDKEVPGWRSCIDAQAYDPVCSPATVLALKRNAPEESYVVMYPGAGEPLKMWPAEYFAGLADSLYEQLGLPTYIIGGREDRVLIDRIISMGNPDAMRALVGCETGDRLSLVANAAAVVSANSGGGHLAAALRVPVVVVAHGPTARVQTSPINCIAADDLVSTCEFMRCAQPCNNKTTCVKKMSPLTRWWAQMPVGLRSRKSKRELKQGYGYVGSARTRSSSVARCMQSILPSAVAEAIETALACPSSR